MAAIDNACTVKETESEDLQQSSVTILSTDSHSTTAKRTEQETHALSEAPHNPGQNSWSRYSLCITLDINIM